MSHLPLVRWCASGVLAALVSVLVFPGTGLAQVGAEALARQSLRPYWFVFIAYAAGWVLVLGWVVSISRRLARLDVDITD